VNVDILTRLLIDACCTQLIYMNSGGTGQQPTKFIPDVVWSSSLLMRTYSDIPIRFHCINQYMVLFCYCSLGGDTTMPGGLQARVCHACVKSIICTHSAFMWRKDCENRSSISGDIRLNTPVFLPCRTRSSQMSSVNSGVTGLKFTKFLRDIQVSFTLLMRIFR